MKFQLINGIHTFFTILAVIPRCVVGRINSLCHPGDGKSLVSVLVIGSKKEMVGSNYNA